MINVEDLSHLLPLTAGKVVGIASYRGEYVIVAYEHAILRVWDDGLGLTHVSRGPESDREKVTG